MPTKTFSADTVAPVSFGIEARSDAGYRVLSYSGSLGGGTLRVHTQVDGGEIVPVPDSKLAAADVDGDSDPKQQLVFTSAGNVFVSLTGATAPNCKVSVV
ncbi:hypothetical protein CN154_15030 [Sinorhizobium meliloti]|uniref:hypothetical protein n=1 Tax=Rhizobium meliloti TaxID=382 RepID=UPI000FDCBE5B|nr:hypothetical protein [Sinorhizobium meliloti]RVK75415.1 hypothetical protein CN154_15030 [Sinorhizobium meliloti]